MFIKERFAELAKQNEDALKSADSDATLKRVPPANLVTKTGNEWKDLPAEVKVKYEERYAIEDVRICRGVWFAHPLTLFVTIHRIQSESRSEAIRARNVDVPASGQAKQSQEE
jgi:hypothetical protein